MDMVSKYSNKVRLQYQGRRQSKVVRKEGEFQVRDKGRRSKRSKRIEGEGKTGVGEEGA